MDDKLEQLLVSKLDFIKKIQGFLPDSHSEEEREIINLLKQCSYYNFVAQILRKLQRKYNKTGSKLCLHFIAMTQI